MNDKKDLFSILFFIVVLTCGIGSIVIGIILIFKKSVWLGIGVYLMGQIVSGLLSILSARLNKSSTPVASTVGVNDLVNSLENAPEITPEEPREDENDPLFKDIPENWWSDWKYFPKDTPEVHFTVNSGKKDTPEDSKKDAKMNADISLAQYVELIFTTYVSKNGNITEVTTIQKSHADLTQARYKYHFEEDGTCYVLAALPTGELADKLKSEISTKFIKNPAAEEANKKMQAAIDKYFSTDSKKTEQK